jgi:hypothetical protein
MPFQVCFSLDFASFRIYLCYTRLAEKVKKNPGIIKEFWPKKDKPTILPKPSGQFSPLLDSSISRQKT